MFTGEHNTYFWIEQPDGFLSSIRKEFPELFLSHYLVNTSFDSGSLHLAAEEINQGWRKHGDLTLSPLITDVMDIPYDQFDEWYLFKSRPDLTVFQNYQVFVNYGGFSLQNPNFSELQKKFWDQLDAIHPETYISEGDYLIIVTKSQDAFQKIVQKMNT